MKYVDSDEAKRYLMNKFNIPQQFAYRSYICVQDNFNHRDLEDACDVLVESTGNPCFNCTDKYECSTNSVPERCLACGWLKGRETEPYIVFIPLFEENGT